MKTRHQIHESIFPQHLEITSTQIWKVSCAGWVIRHCMCREHQKYQQSIPWWHAQSFLSNLSDKRTVDFLKLNKPKARQVVDPLGGHCHLKSHIFKLGVTDSPSYGRCHMGTETSSHILCECAPLAELRFCFLCADFMAPSDHEEVLLRKILYFIKGKGLLE
jgi:hypothetical protein